jgi:hypothetical protein
MTGQVVNLNKARKARAKAAAKAGADANAARFGRTRAERAAEAAEERRKATHLDAHRRDPDPDGGSA